MININNISLILLVVLCLTSCENFFSSTIEVDPPEHEDRMVLHAFATPNDSVLAVGVARSSGLLERIDDRSKVNDATVDLYEDGELISELTAIVTNEDEPFNYVAFKPAGRESIFQNGKTYEIRAEHPDFQTISSSQTVPDRVEIIKATLDDEQRPTPDGGLAYSVTIEFNDPAGIENFYEIKLYNLIPVDNGQVIEDQMYLESTDFGTSESAYGNGLLLRDNAFDGQKYTLSILFYNEPFDIRLQWNTITEDYYLYAKSITDYWNAGDFGFFAEPVSVYTNVENGLGLFGLVDEQFIEIE